MDEIDGMSLARTIRKTDTDATIIFITSTRDFALEVYDVNALHYLIKPVDTLVLEQLIISDYNKRFQNSFFILESEFGKQRININNIICLETKGRQVEITLMDDTFYYSGRLSKLLLALPKHQFIRCHQAFALNIRNVRELTKQDAIAVNGKAIPVSRTFVKDVRKAFARELRDNGN